MGVDVNDTGRGQCAAPPDNICKHRWGNVAFCELCIRVEKRGEVVEGREAGLACGDHYCAVAQ